MTCSIWFEERLISDSTGSLYKTGSQLTERVIVFSTKIVYSLMGLNKGAEERRFVLFRITGGSDYWLVQLYEWITLDRFPVISRSHNNKAYQKT